MVVQKLLALNLTGQSARKAQENVKEIKSYHTYGGGGEM
jgi:hypothetical protein